MIDRIARDRLAFKLRRLASGRITNDDYDEEYPVQSADRGVEAVSYAGWSLYGDLWNYRLRGHYALSAETLRGVARCVLFLHSDAEYEWPVEPSRDVLWWLVHLFTLGRVDTRKWGAWQEWEATGEYSVWPFFRRADLERVAQSPRFLRSHGGAAA